VQAAPRIKLWRVLIRSFLQHWFRQHPELQDLLKPLVRALGYTWPLNQALVPLLSRRPMRAIQVGANDGVTHDPYRQYLIRRGWQAVAVEPNRWIFETLQRNYRSYPQVKPLNAAVSYSAPELTLWSFDEAYLAAHPQGVILSTLVSFSREQLASGFAPGSEELDHICSFTIPCLTLEAIARQQNWDRVDAIFVDVEGYENEILLPADFDALSPQVVVFENHMLPDKGAAICEKLAARGMRCDEIGADTICYFPQE
jgi:FkbM family methyltransferase